MNRAGYLRLATWVLLGLGLIAAFGMMRLASEADLLDPVNAWTEKRGLLGMVLFAIFGGVSSVFFFPGSVFMTASGAAFGLSKGFATALVGVTLGASLAFLVSRYLARKRVENWVQRKPGFAAVDAAIGREGWKIVLLTRCCPAFPYIFQNYAYGLTRVNFRHYTWGSFLGLVPATLIFAYVGSVGRAGVETASGQGDTWKLALNLVGLAITVAVSLYITRVAQRALRQAGV